ncbi:zinc finger protein 616 [Drosophila albomicans]|uniref:Zinc finger protein 616 n=1 Tax=Drosophila albomicans TaxID=7291 RepID=A0A6P8YUS5_DROAB|nr:zinc finger protein 616 [Drosophila albomicans]
MSKENSESSPSCLHCRVHDSKQTFHEIFDDVGIDIELPNLLAKYFQLSVKPDPKKQQLLCLECVNTLIRFFDIDELQREQDAANAAKKDRPLGKNDTKTASETSSTTPAKAEAKPTKKQASPAAKAKIEPKKEIAKLPVKPKPAPAPVAAPAAATPPHAEESVAVRISKGKTLTVTPKRIEIKPKSKASVEKPVGKRGNSKEADSGEQEQIGALLRDIFGEEKMVAKEKLIEIAEAVQQSENIDNEEQKQLEENVQEEEQSLKEPDNPDVDELEFLLEGDSSDLDVPQLKTEKRSSHDTTQSQNESESENETHKVEPFNFVLIRESDDVGDLYEYLSTVVKTCFETLSFDWATVCQHCSLKCGKFETLLSHMLKCHQMSGQQFKCPTGGCDKQLRGRKFLAMHLVLMHAPVAEIPIYGSCPECNLTFSNILQYNKHSCAHVIKKRRGIRLYCEMCGLEFPSWKRFNFHNQFHLERHRPRACFVCDYADNNIDELFQHLHYSHEPEGSLFCDLCDRTFRDAAIFADHNKSHTNVTTNTYTCSECNASFDTRGRLNGHMRITHGTVISCEMCNREFATEASYNVHMKKHLIIEREVHVCNNCGLLSESNDKMTAHVENEDSVCFGVDIYVELLRDAYICEYCSTYYKTKSDLRAHRDSGLHKDGVFCCQPCGKEFNDMKLYRHHMRTYQLQRADVAHRKLEICLYFMCDYEDCTESYISWNSLYTHKRRTHDLAEKLDAKPKADEWICQFCQKQCRSKMSLSVHVARSHNNNNVACKLCKASYKDDEALKKHHAYWHEPVECSLCFKVVKNRRNFDTHMNVVHSDNKRYACSVCQKGFYHKSEMEAHKRLHNQSYSCEKCSFITRSKKSLAVHVLGQHYRRFAFECKQCTKRFGRQQGLTNHILRVHSTKFTCRDFLEGGCNRAFNTSAQLTVHVRKVHNSSISVTEDVDDEAVDLEPEEEEQQEEQEQQSIRKSKRQRTTASSPLEKKRCVRLSNDTLIEFINAESKEDQKNATDSEIFEELQESKANILPPKRRKRQC